MVILGNVRINSEEEFYQFKKSIKHLFKFFEEAHIKIRGKYKIQSLDYLNNLKINKLHLYQNLDEKDWVSTTKKIIDSILDRNIFIYVNDHFIVAKDEAFKDLINEFDDNNLDYLRYSFFGGYSLNTENILPLEPSQRSSLDFIDIDKNKYKILRKISPNYFNFSLVSMVSKDFLKKLISKENKRIKIFSSFFSRILESFLNIYTIKKFFSYINNFFSRLNVIFLFYDKSSPFNLEKTIDESEKLFSSYRLGILKEEIFANFDDDNTVYKSSLIKRGLYPFGDLNSDEKLKKYKFEPISFKKKIPSGKEFSLKYVPLNGRIIDLPIIQIEVLKGRIKLFGSDKEFLNKGEILSIFSNLKHKIMAFENSIVKIDIFDKTLEKK